MLGFLVQDGNNQHMIHNINTLSKTNRCTVFSGSLIPSLQTNVMQRYEAFHFNGEIIRTISILR